MNDEQLSHVLERLAEKAVPAGSSIWDKLEVAYLAETKPKRLPFAMNWAAVFVAVLALSLLTTGGALAYILLTNFPADAGGQNVANAGLGIALNQSQTVNGVTIHLVQGYADAERILLFYTLEGIDPTRFNRRAPEAQLNEVFTLDGLDNYQMLDALQYQYRRDEDRVLLVSSFRHAATSSETLDFDWQLIVNNLGEVVPPEFHFSLSLPIAESLIIPVNQSLTVDDLTVRLESIEIGSASSTFRLCTTLPAAYDSVDFNDLGLLIDGRLYVYVSEQNFVDGREHCMEQSFDAGILTGTETLEVTFSGLFLAPVPSQADIDSALAELQAVGIEAEITLVDGHIDWEILSNAQNYNTDVWLRTSLYDYRQIDLAHTFSVSLSDLVLGQR